MSLVQKYIYNTGTSFTFDSSLIEFSSGKAKLKSQIPQNATFYATYTSSINGTYGLGSLTAGSVGTPGVLSGKLDLTGDTNKYVYYACAGNAANTTQGAIKLKYTPNYSGSPVTDKIIFSFNTSDGTSVNNLIELNHRNTGQFNLAIYSSTAVAIYDGNVGAWSPTSGTQYEIELDLDILTGATRLFIDGVQLGATITNTGTRTSSTNFYIGVGKALNETSNAKYDDVIVFSTFQHTANYTPGYTLSETVYPTSNPSIVVNQSISSVGIDAFVETSDALSGTDAIKHVLLIDAAAKYWNGIAWVTSNDTYAQSSLASDINSNVATLSLPGNGIVLETFLHSGDGSTTPALSEIDITYENYNVIAPPTTCDVYLKEKDFLSAGQSADSLVIENTASFFNGGNLIRPNIKTFAFNSIGYLTVTLVVSGNHQYKFSLNYTDNGAAKTAFLGYAYVPNQASVALSSILSL